MITLGVLADTHVPDRAPNLNPRVLGIFERASVKAILHAGDVSVPGVLEQLGSMAPVHAVRGNRDWVALKELPAAVQLDFNDVRVGLTHGHGQVWDYLIDRVKYVFGGYRLEMFQPRLLAAFPQANVIVFGHTHRALNLLVNGILLFNPGSVHFPDEKDTSPSVGLLHLHGGGSVEGEIIWLDSIR
jgi:putative phosphoesterase